MRRPTAVAGPKRGRPSKGPKGTAAGREIIGALTDLLASMDGAGPAPATLTVRTVELPDEPRAYSAEAVRATRLRLGASQAVFARLMGVSTKLVQAWEAGTRDPAGRARRFMDVLNGDTRPWVDLLARNGMGRGPSSSSPARRAAVVGRRAGKRGS